ncbi:G patch domain-containing protein 11 [Culicoides brevitarsis]|uniref:G patch domain-containing protein 11 n=1 Tax=Culicoides brevitarsis TaxID=469753 RepID=UPI00307B8573
MSSDEDDYMSDKILAACTSNTKTKDIRPGLIHNHSRKREHELAVKKARLDEEQKKKQQPALRLQEGLSTSLSSSNKGFAMLQKMGYKEGQALGKSETGIKEPIGLQIKNDRGGLGREAAIKEIQEFRAQAALKRATKSEDQITPEEYRRQMALKSQTKQIDFDLAKAQKACERLDRDLKVTYPIMKFFWPENRLPVDEEDEKDEETEEKEPEKYENSEKLEMLTRYLRSCYFYCIYCGTKYENAEDFQANCPGPSKDDH